MEGTSRQQRSGIRRAAGAVLLLTVSMVLALLAGEVLTRFVYRDLATTGQAGTYFNRRWNSAHPRTLNTWGFREREPAPKRDDTYRIALIGDSFAYGQGLLTDETLSAQLEARLNSVAEPGRGFEVLNFGVGGANTVHEIETLNEYVLGASPDFVLLQWYTNDVEGEDKSERPAYRRLVPSDRLQGFLRYHSALYHVAESYWLSLQVRLGMGEDFNDYLVRRFEDPNGEPARAAAAALEEFVATARQAGTRVAIVMYPRLAGLESLDAYSLDFLSDRVLEFCATEEIRCVDLRPTFAPIEPFSSLTVNRFDAHPSVLANQLAADAVFEALSSEWLSGAVDWAAPQDSSATMTEEEADHG